MKSAEILSEHTVSHRAAVVRLAKAIGLITGSCPHEQYVRWEACGGCVKVCGQEGRGGSEERECWAWLCWLEWSLDENEAPPVFGHQGRGNLRRMLSSVK